MKLHSVWNAYEEIQFNGIRLARSSTETDLSTRWIEIEIYKTERGRYIIHRVGVSLVYHMHESSKCPGKGVPTRFGELVTDAVPCPQCRPLRKLEPDDIVDAESDRHQAQVCDANQVQDCLMVRPYKGEPFLSSPARKALDQAIAADPSLTAETSSVRFVE